MKRGSLAIAITSACCFGFSGPMAKFVQGAGLSPVEAVWVRMAGAGLLMLAVLALVRPRVLRVPRGRYGFFAAYALVAVAAVQALFFLAITRLPVGVALLLEYAAPVLVVGWVRLVRRVRLPWAAYLGALVAVAGLAVVVEVWQGSAVDALGLLIGLAGAACCAAYFLLSDRSKDLDVDPLGLVAWGMAGAAVVLLPIARPWGLRWAAFTESVTIDGRTLPVAVAAGCLIAVATVAAYLLGVTAVRRLSAAVGATVATLEVIAGAVIAWVLLGEALGPAQILGGLTVLAGALLAQTATVRRTAAPAPASAPEPVPVTP